MASATVPEDAELASVFERLLRDQDLSLPLPFLLRLASSSPSPRNPDDDTPNYDTVILVNPFTRRVIVIDGLDTLDSLIREYDAKNGPPPASKASIEALPTVQIGDANGECSICLDELEPDRVVKEMPCKHKFHSTCIDKWLGFHGSCPVCRYKMPVDDEETGHWSDREEVAERRTETDIWFSFAFSRNRRNQSTNQTTSTDYTHIDT